MGQAAQPNPHGYAIGDAFNYGWQKFQQNIGVIILGTLAYLAAIFVVTVVWFFLMGAIGLVGEEAPGAGVFAMLVATAVMALVGMVGFFLVQAGITRAALAVTYGQKIEVRTLFAFDGIGQLVLGAIVLGIATAFGFLLCYIPGLIVIFFSQFFVHFLLDKRLSAIDAIKASVSFVNRNLATLVGFYVASLIAYAVGSLLCGIGILIAFPVVVIAQAYTYRRLQGEPVAA